MASAKSKLAAKSGVHIVNEAGTRAWVRKPIDPSLVGTLAEGRELMPKVPDVVLNLDQVRFSRWSASYKKPLPPFYVSKSYGPRSGMTSKAALFFVLAQVWTWHEECTGEPCPYDFPGLAADPA